MDMAVFSLLLGLFGVTVALVLILLQLRRRSLKIRRNLPTVSVRDKKLQRKRRMGYLRKRIAEIEMEGGNAGHLRAELRWLGQQK